MPTYQEMCQTYEFKGKIGSGGIASVYLAWHKRLGKEVVFKEIAVDARSRVDRKEVDILKSLRHEALPGVLDYVEMDGKYYAVMDYIRGLSLEDFIETGRKISQKQLTEWAITLCRAMEVLHAQNPPIIHCDIKPANIMIDNKGKIYLIDFNVSYYLHCSGALGYTKGYSAPELVESLSLRGQRTGYFKDGITERVDIFGLGSTLYALIAGKQFDMQHPDWDVIESRVSESLGEIIKKSVKYDPARRFQSAAEMRHAFESIQENDVRLMNLKKKQQVKNIVCAAGFAFFAILCGISIYMLGTEKTSAYNDIIDQQIAASAAGNYDRSVELFENATDIKYNDLQAYYQKGLALHNKGDYQSAAEFLSNNVKNNSAFNDQDNIENAYYILADSWFNIRRYDSAVEVYELLMEMDNLEPYYYRDYAIAMGYSGQIDKAQEILEDASLRGLEEDSLQYARAELLFLQDQTQEAITLMSSIVKSTKDEDLKRIGYTQLGDWYLSLNQPDQAYVTLKEACSVIPVSRQPVLLEYLAQSQISLANANEDASMRKEALSTLQIIEENGWASKSTYNTKAILYQKLGDLDNAERALSEMEKLYGEDYVLFKRKASLELDRQALLDSSQRNYMKFKEYYERARDLYNNNENDEEMLTLKASYDQAKSGGWFDT